MPIVVATLVPHPDKFDEVVQVYTNLVPEVHAENGCELFSVHTSRKAVVLVERWTTAEDLQAHATGPVFAQLNDQLEDLLAAPAAIEILRNIPLGTPKQGTIQ